MSRFTLDTGRTNLGTHFHILFDKKLVASMWSADHDPTIANEILRVLSEHADAKLIDSKLNRGPR
jgi:hypothetical protein